MAWQAWFDLTAVRVGSVETLAPLQIAWLEIPTLPQALFTSTETFEPMVALGPTVWLLVTRVSFMVVTSTRLPPALPWTTTSPPTVSTLPVRLDQLVCRLIWLLRIWLPAPESCDWSLQVPTPWAKAALVERARTEAARRALKDFMGGAPVRSEILWVRD